MITQEKFWQGKFGKSYSKRSSSYKLEKGSFKFFKRIFKKKYNFKSILELGSNTGNNLIALSKIYKKAELEAVEINSYACKRMKKRNKKITINNISINKFDTKKKYDLVIVKGVLIHIDPKKLSKIYKKLVKFSKKYILVAEYFSSNPTQVIYRGHKNKLFKRDFAGEILNKFSKIKLVDYGFIYKRDKDPEDDLNWFLLKK